MKITLKNIEASRTRSAANMITPERMPPGRYAFTVKTVVFSDTEKDMALYVNFDVHGENNLSKSMNVRCEPQMAQDDINFKRNLASVAIIANLLDAAQPESGKQFKKMVAAASTAHATGQDDAFNAAINSIYELVDGLSGLNFTGYFEWNTSKKDGKKYFNLRNERGNPDQVISLDHVREPVTHEDNVPEGLKAKRTLIKGKR
jgi:hypothetical protein